MNDLPISTASEITPAWFSKVLKADGSLSNGNVENIHHVRTQRMGSVTDFLEIRYSPDAPMSAPKKLVLKTPRPENLPSNDTEVRFYRDIVPPIPKQIAPHCFHTAFEPTKGTYHLLIEDVSDTHMTTTYPLPPSVPHAESMVDTLAALHGYWWQQDQASSINAPSDEAIDRYISEYARGLSPLIKTMGDRLSREDRKILEHVLERLGAAMKARAIQGNITTVHGDAHGWNFLLPRKGQPGSAALLIDRQLFDWALPYWVGVSDLSYLMVHWWPRDRRQALETDLMERYWDNLQAEGVEGYTQDMLWDDYQLCAIQSLLVPLGWCAQDNPGATAHIWNDQLLHALAAFSDLNCRERLG